MMKANYDVIVIGVGSMGSSACYYLARRGYRTLGLEQFDSPHEFGSHAGQSRIIRRAYFEDPGYVPLLNQAYQNWKSLEEETGEQLYHRTGLVYLGRPDNELMKGVQRSATQYNIPIDRLDTMAATRRFPQFRLPEGFEALYETDAGFIQPEKAIKLYKEQAIRKGCSIQSDEKVLDWK